MVLKKILNMRRIFVKKWRYVSSTAILLRVNFCAETRLIDLSAFSADSCLPPQKNVLRMYLKEMGDQKTILKETQVEAAVGFILFWQCRKVTKNRKAYGRGKNTKFTKGISHPNTQNTH